jgi:serine phosphatase RsbU (regulator of sigma subunit)
MTTVPDQSSLGRAHGGSHALECMEIWGHNGVGERTAQTPGVEVFVHSTPYGAAAAGGDIHYVSVCGSGRITRTLLADIAGHGAQVDGIARQLRDLVRRNINNPYQKRLVRDLNNQFTALDKTSQFATAVVATILPRKRRLTLCNAGHPRPLFYSARAGAWRLLAAEKESEGDLPLGIAPEVPYSQFALPFTAGDVLLMYTDGLVEATNAAGAQLGEEGLMRLAAGLPTADLPKAAATLLAGLRAYCGDCPAADDLTLLFLRHSGNTKVRYRLRERLRVYGRLFGLLPNETGGSES